MPSATPYIHNPANHRLWWRRIPYSDASPALRLRRRWSRREAVAAHDLRHLCPVRRTTGRRVDHLGSLAEILRTDRGWRDHAERLHVLASIVIEPVNGASRNAERLSRPDVDLFSVDSPGQYAVDTVDRLLVMVVAVRWSRQALRAGTMSSKAAMLPVELSPVSRKRTVSGPTRMVSSEGLTWRSMVCCVMLVPFSKVRLPCHDSKRSLRNMSIPSSLNHSQVETRDMLIGALLRVPAQAIQRRIIKELNAAGFEELRLPHIAVLQFPGPDGVRPGILAERAGMSKQAMNQLLRSLETLGYIVRSDARDEGRARIIRFTKRGRAAYSKIYDILRDIEREWSVELGSKRFAQLKELLIRVWESPLTR